MPIFERIMVAAGNVALCCVLSNVAQAQTTGDQTGSIALGARGGFSADSPTLRTQPQDRPENAFGYTMGAGMASDYIYRGVTLSDHRSEEHTSELQSHLNLVCRLLLVKKNEYSSPYP